MSEERIKFYSKKVCWGVEESMPMMQGLAIKEVIKQYRIPARQWGYYLDVIGVRTNKQEIFWKDSGVGLKFLGLLNRADKTVELPKCDNRQGTVFATMKELQKEINKRDYSNIKGLRARITEEEYDYYLNVLPPLFWKGTTFYLSESLDGELYYKFWKNSEGHWCEVSNPRKDHPELTEEQFVEEVM